MEENIQLGLSMLIIGMVTVFFILIFVVTGGNILIRLANKYFPIKQDSIPEIESSSGKGEIAAIIAAVDVATEGKGKIANIKKIRS